MLPQSQSPVWMGQSTPPPQVEITNPFARPQIASSVKYGWKLRLPLWNLTSEIGRNVGQHRFSGEATEIG